MLVYYIACMEKTRTFIKRMAFGKKAFEMKVDLNLITDKSDVWLCEIEDVPFVFSISRPGVENRYLIQVIAELEDLAQEYANKSNINLMVETLAEKGFTEALSDIEFEIDDEPEG